MFKSKSLNSKRLEFRILGLFRISNFGFRVYGHPAGYIALLTVVIVSAVIVTISLTTPLLVVSESQIALGRLQSEQSLSFLEGCVADALLRLNEDGSIPSSLPLPDGTCSVTIDSQSGIVTMFTVAGSLSGYPKSIQVRAVRNNTITITKWIQT